ncbi:MAG: hypothetical protein VX835_00135 [Pseudomonadota bacterium]|nr:hypothetical protein [Pseudomonadota bacterium]
MNHSSFHRRLFIKESIVKILTLFKQKNIKISDIEERFKHINKFKNVATNVQLHDLEKLKKKFEAVKSKYKVNYSSIELIEANEIKPIEPEKKKLPQTKPIKPVESEKENPPQTKQSQSVEPEKKKPLQTKLIKPVEPEKENPPQTKQNQSVDTMGDDYDMYPENDDQDNIRQLAKAHEQLIPRLNSPQKEATKVEEFSLDSTMTLEDMPRIMLQTLNFRPEIKFKYKSLLELLINKGDVNKVTKDTDKNTFKAIFDKLNHLQDDSNNTFNQILDAITLFLDIMTPKDELEKITDKMLDKKLEHIKKTNMKIYLFFFEPIDKGISYLSNKPLIFLLFEQIKQRRADFDNFKSDEKKSILIFWFSAMEHLMKNHNNKNYNDDFFNKIHQNNQFKYFLSCVLTNHTLKSMGRFILNKSKFTIPENTISDIREKLHHSMELVVRTENHRLKVFESIKNKKDKLDNLSLFSDFQKRQSKENDNSTENGSTPQRLEPSYPPFGRVRQPLKQIK